MEVEWLPGGKLRNVSREARGTPQVRFLGPTLFDLEREIFIFLCYIFMISFDILFFRDSDLQ